MRLQCTVFGSVRLRAGALSTSSDPHRNVPHKTPDPGIAYQRLRRSMSEVVQPWCSNRNASEESGAPECAPVIIGQSAHALTNFRHAF